MRLGGNEAVVCPDDRLLHLPAFLHLLFSEIVCPLASMGREPDMKRSVNDGHRALTDKHDEEQTLARKQRLRKDVMRLMLFGVAHKQIHK